jgi:hypothetical protein
VDGSSQERWRHARATLASSLSPATYQAWLSTLELAGQDPSASTSRNTAEGAAAADVPAAHASAPITLACRTAFQLGCRGCRAQHLIGVGWDSLRLGCPVAWLRGTV